MSKMGAIALFLFCLNISLALVPLVGFTTGLVTPYYSISQANEEFSPEETQNTLTGIAAIDDTLYGVSLVTDALGLIKDVIYNMTLGVYDLYYQILLLFTNNQAGGLETIALGAAVVHYLVMFAGLLDYASGRRSEI